MIIGLSIGSRTGRGGATLGVFVLDHRGQRGFLTSAIALSAGGGTSQEVYQPSSLDAGTLAIRDLIGQVQSFTVLRKNTFNTSDAALVRLAEDMEAVGNKIPDSFGCEFAGLSIGPELLSIDELSPSTRVAKIGCSTGYTEGVVTALKHSITVKSVEEEIRFADVIGIKGESAQFSSPGDSGALVFTIPDLKPVGLLFAGGKINQESLAYACRLDLVLELFQAQILR